MTALAPSTTIARAIRCSDDIVPTEPLARLADPLLTDAQRAAAREQFISSQIGLAWRVARRFRDRGEPLEDLAQVAMLGLLKAVDGFDPRRGTHFASYAVPTMEGEVKRHFRDKGWNIRVPRRLQELRMDCAKASRTLTQELGRTPTAADLARHLEVGEAEIRECILSSRAYSATSLSSLIGPDGATGTVADLLGGPDHELDAVIDREWLRPVIARLAPRERRLIELRFHANLTQSQIAAQLGISQMHVSRLLSRTLNELRGELVTHC